MALKKTKRKKVDKVLRKLKKKVSDYSSQLGFLPNRQPSQLSQLDINSLSHTSYADLNISRYYTTSWYNRVDDFQGLY